MKKRRGLTLVLALILTLSNFVGGISTDNLVFAQGNYTGSDIVDSLSVSPTDIAHTGNFTIAVTFSGQSEDSNEGRYIYPGKEIYIPIVGDGVALAQLNSQLPQIENTEVTADGNGIRIRFLDGIQNQYDISGNLRITMSGLNSEEGSTHTLTVGGEHHVKVTNNVSGDVGVFAGKTGMMYGESRPGYVTWFLRGNINGDAWPGGPLKIHDKLGEGQILDGSGIHIGLYWGGQQHQTFSKTYASIEEFLNDPNFGSSQGSSISYNMKTGEIDIYIPEAVLSEKEFAFTYNTLITNHDLDEFTNRGEFDFHEKGKPGRIEENAVVTNIDVGGGIVGKTRASININKFVAGTTTPIPNVQFEVARDDGGPLFQGKEDVKVILTTNEKGQIRAKGFRPGKMILREVGAPEWINYDPLKEIILDIKANNDSEINTIENEAKRISIKVSKSWQDNNNQDGMRPDSIIIKLLADGAETDKKLVLNNTNDWMGTFINLDEYKDGKKIVYTAEEDEVEGYETKITGDTVKGFTVTNAHEVEKISIEGSKTWDDNNNQDGKRPANITIRLLANGKEIATKEVTGDDWNWKFENLDKFKNGEEIVYTITEDAIKGYSSEVKGYNVTNKYTPGKTSVQVIKSWKDNEDQDKIRPNSVKIKLLANGEITDKELILTKDNNWTGVFTGLDEYRNGKKILYTVKEVKVEGYKTAITGDAVTGFTVTNTHEVEKISIEGSKTWDDDNNQDGKRPDSITVRLLANGKEIAIKEVTGDDWNWRFENLDKFENGERIVYTITEDSVKGYSSEVSGYDVTNKYTPGKTSVQVTKAWRDNENQDGVRANSVTIKLLAGGETTDKKLILTKENNWTGTFTNLDEYKNGKKIVYTVEEVKIEGYETVITGDATTGFTVINIREIKEPTKPTKPMTPTKPTKPSSNLPKTGDGSGIYLWIGLMIISMSALIILTKKKRKYQ